MCKISLDVFIDKIEIIFPDNKKIKNINKILLMLSTLKYTWRHENRPRKDLNFCYLFFYL